MKRIIIPAAAAACFAVSAFSLPAMAGAGERIPDVRKFDLFDDGRLDLKEQTAYERVLERLDDNDVSGANDLLFELSSLRADVAKPGDPIEIERLLKAQEAYLTPDGEDANACVEAALSIQSSVLDQPLNRCQLGPDAPDKRSGAAFSVANDFDNGDTTVVIKGGIGLKMSLDPEDTAFEEAALGIFLEADGAFRDNGASNTGYARAGAKAEVDFEVTGLFANVNVGLGGYYQSDLGLRSEGYGLQIAATPQSARRGINGYIGKKNEAHHFLLLGGVVDGFHVSDAGDTGLDAGEDYLWLGGYIGGVAFTPAIGKGARATARLDAFIDVISGEDAIRATAGVDLLLTENGAAAIGLDYTHGRSRQDLESEDKLVLSLKVLF